MPTIKSMKEFNKEHGNAEAEAFEVEEIELTEEEMMRPPKMREIIRKAKFRHANGLAGILFREPHRAFFADMVAVCGDISKACKQCDIPVGTINYHLRRNRSFRRDVDHAIDRYKEAYESWRSMRLEALYKRHSYNPAVSLLNNIEIEDTNDGSESASGDTGEHREGDQGDDAGGEETG